MSPLCHPQVIARLILEAAGQSLTHKPGPSVEAAPEAAMRRKSNSASKEATTMKRFGSATGSGSLRDGKGAVSTESQAMKKHPYRFFSRYGDTPGANPEELVGAAHAACFTMPFLRMLGMAHFVRQWVDSHSDVVIEKDGDGFSRSQQRQRPAALFPS
jgi:osmotically inducible protein OsmC